MINFDLTKLDLLNNDINLIYNPEKNKKLKIERGINFDDVKSSIEKGNPYYFRAHHNPSYVNQVIMDVQIANYFYTVPFVISDANTFFLKTVFPNRKVTQFYLGVSNVT